MALAKCATKNKLVQRNPSGYGRVFFIDNFVDRNSTEIDNAMVINTMQVDVPKAISKSSPNALNQQETRDCVSTIAILDNDIA